MEITSRRTINDQLKKYTHSGDDSDIIEIVEWVNGEGYDICIEKTYDTNHISLSIDELFAIDYLIKSLNIKQ